MSYNTPNTEISAARQLLSAPITSQTLLNLARTNSLAIILANGTPVAISGNTAAAASTEELNPSTQVWSTTGNLPATIGFDGIYHKSQVCLLNDGRVLAMGGTDNGSITNRSETYSPVTHTWTVQGTMANARFEGCMVTLTAGPNAGKALAIGGNTTGSAATAVAQCELYDPTANTWSTSGAGTLNTARYAHAAVVLQNGNVLVVGGFDTSSTRTLVVEIYDATAGTWSTTGSLAAGRLDPWPVVLANGDVIVFGGNGTGGATLSSTERFNGSTWTTVGAMTTGRQNPAGVLLTAGPNVNKVLVAGGNNGGTLSSAELFNPSNNTWSSTTSMNSAHGTMYPQIILISSGALSGKIIAIGGGNNVSELYDQTAGTWTNTAQTQQFAAVDWSTRTLKDTAGATLLNWGTPGTVSVPGLVSSTTLSVSGNAALNGGSTLSGTVRLNTIQGINATNINISAGQSTTTAFNFNDALGTQFVIFDAANHQVGIGRNTAPNFTLDVGGVGIAPGTGHFLSDLQVDTKVVVNTVKGRTTGLALQPSADSSTAIQLQNAAGTISYLTIDSSGNNVTLPNASSFIITGTAAGGSISLTSGTGNSGNISMTTGTGGSGNSGSITLTTADVAGNSQTTGTSGGITLTTGNNSSVTGFSSGNTGVPTGLTITSGSVVGGFGSETGSSGNSGVTTATPNTVVGSIPVALTITTGTARSLSGDSHTAGTSGSILISSGGVTTSNDNNLSSGPGGSLILTTGKMNVSGFFGGNNEFTGTGGNIWLASGDALSTANNNTSGAGGNLTLTSGNAANASSSNNSGAGGSITLKSGDATNNIGTGGSINLTTGNSAGSAVLTSGGISITTGTSQGALNSGSITITTAADNASNATLTGGGITLTSGSKTGGGVTNGGSITLTSGNTQVGGQTCNGGSITLTTGSKTAGGLAVLNGGSITLTTGNPGAGTTDSGGSISLTSFNVANGGNLSLTGSGTGHGQITVGGNTPNVSASVDIQSTTRGFLPPRMSTTQKNAIATPATGLVVYDSTLNLLQLYNGTSWTSVGAVVNFVTREVPSGTVNGVNAVFTLANTPVVGSEEIFLNGLLQNVGALNDYTISGATITFNTAPDSGSAILVTYRF